MELPQTEDPDSLVQSGGRTHFAELISAAQPLVDWLWETLLETADLSTPERTASLRRDVDTSIRLIRDREVRHLYRREFDSRLSKLLGQRFRYKRNDRVAGDRSSRQVGDTKPRQPAASVQRNLENLILLVLVNHPVLLAANQELIAAIVFSDPDGIRLQDALLAIAASESSNPANALAKELNELQLDTFVEKLRSDQLLKVHSFAGKSVEIEAAEHGLHHLLARLRTLRILENEVTAAQQQLAAAPTDDSWRRFKALKNELRQVCRLEIE